MCVRLSHRPSGHSKQRRQQQKLFDLCTPIETDDDIALFFENMYVLPPFPPFPQSHRYPERVAGLIFDIDVCGRREGTVAQIVQYNNDNNNYNHGMNINKVSITSCGPKRVRVSENSLA
jgi:hypothetical protein